MESVATLGRTVDAPAGLRGGGELDLRLAAGALTGWLALLALRRASAGVVLLAGCCCVLVGLACLLPWRRFGPAFVVVGLAALCGGGALFPLAARVQQAYSSPVVGWAVERRAVLVELTVSGDPRPLVAGVSGQARIVVDGSLRTVVTGGRREQVTGSVVVFAPSPGWLGLVPGQRISFDGRLAPAQPGDLAVATLTARGAPNLIGRPPWWQRLASRIRVGLPRAARVLPGDARGLLPGLIDGDTSALNPVLAQRFKTAGLTHLVAVSGTNCVIVVGAALLVLRRLRAPPWLSAALSAVALIGFVVVARPSPSVLRAAVMAGVALAALAAGRPRAGVPMVAAAALVAMVWHPAWVADAGFAMSVLATMALLVIAPGWADALRRRGVPPVLAEGAAVAAAAHLVTAPIIVMLSGQVSLVAIPANLLAEPVVAPATVLGVLAAVVSLVSLPVATGLAWLAGWPVRWLVADADFFGSLPGGTVGWPATAAGAGLLAALAVLIVLACRSRSVRPSLAAAVLVLFLVQFPVRQLVTAWPPPGWLIVACDIGQGDSFVLPAGPHSAVVIDTGPDPVTDDRCLRDLHVTAIPVLVITHLHLDHVGGIAGAVRGRAVGSVLTGPLDEPEGGYALARQVLQPRGLQLRVAPPGLQLTVGVVRLTVLAPVAAFHGTHSDPNNSSLVMRAEVGGHRILLPGDAELDAQQAAVQSGADLTAEILKVPHHGSAYSDEKFLAATGARVGLISVGAHNDYGHPAPSLLAMLARLGIPALRTDRDGDIAVTAHGHDLTTVHRANRAPAGVAGPARSAAPPVRPGVAAVVSAGRDTMTRWPRTVRWQRPHGAAAPGRMSCSWSATRSCSSPEPSSRSPPLCDRRTRPPQ